MERRNFKHLRLALLLAATVFLRAFPRLPNVEPVMASCLPVAKRHGAVAAALFAGLAMLAADALVQRVGWWSLYTAVAYAAVGFAAASFLKPGSSVSRAVGFSIVGTLFFDVTTMFAFAVQFGVPLPIAVAGQVPFTLLHLAGNAVFVAVASPLVEKFVLPAEDAAASPYKTNLFA